MIPESVETRRALFEGMSTTPRGLAPGTQTIQKVHATPTILHDFNFATMVGGIPNRRIITVYGPSGDGKSVFTLALARSYIDRWLPVLLIDAERTLDRDLVNSILGRPIESIPNLYTPDRLMYYEDAVSAVDNFTAMVRKMRADTSDPDLYGLVVVDTINKLAPKSQIDSVLAIRPVDELSTAAANASIDSFGNGREGMRLANINQTWLNRLTPQLAESGCSAVIVAQERKKVVQIGSFAKEIYYPKGGDCLWFDASMIVRITHSDGKSGTIRESADRKSTALATVHKGAIRKTKVAKQPDDQQALFEFFIETGDSNGPAGSIDHTRDLIRTAVKYNVLTKAGHSISFGDVKLGTEKSAVPKVYEDPNLYQQISDALYTYERESRTIRRANLVSIDEETGEAVAID